MYLLIELNPFRTGYLHFLSCLLCSVFKSFFFYICRVFVLAEPEVFSESLVTVVSGDFEVSATSSGQFLNPLDHMRSVVQHSIQAALGDEHCHGPKLAQALKVSTLVLIIGVMFCSSVKLNVDIFYMPHLFVCLFVFN